jgi:hypothetical protein
MIRTALSALTLALAPLTVATAFEVRSGDACEPLPADQQPIRYDVSFEGDIRPYIDNLCASCHGSQGGMSLSLGSVVDALLGSDERGQPSQGDASILRVRPFEPLASSLFLKLNCVLPPFGNPMPLGDSAPQELQALVHDWIASGALLPTSGGSRLFIGRFESIQRP